MKTEVKIIMEMQLIDKLVDIAFGDNESLKKKFDDDITEGSLFELYLINITHVFLFAEKYKILRFDEETSQNFFALSYIRLNQTTGFDDMKKFMKMFRVNYPKHLTELKDFRAASEKNKKGFPGQFYNRFLSNTIALNESELPENPILELYKEEDLIEQYVNQIRGLEDNKMHTTN